MDISSIIGLVLAFGGILGGNALEGGHLNSLMVPTAALIVLAGAAGACMLQNSIGVFLNGIFATRSIFFHKKDDAKALIRQIVEYARRARREGILSLEKEIPNVKNPFFSKALSMAVDGLEPKTLYESMETEIETAEEANEGLVKVWEAMGGYLPTMGILGAVMGLIHVMGKLSDPSKLGPGIAVAFVATIYGVGGANVLCLPIANKIKTHGKEAQRLKEMILKGVLLIQEGVNHSVIEEQLKGYLGEKERKAYAAAAAKAPVQA